MPQTPSKPDVPQNASDELSLTGFFEAMPAIEIAPNSPMQDRRLSAEAVIGESKLTSNGFYVRINDAAPRRAPTNTPAMVLVVEDDETTATLVVAVLEANGYRTMQAANRQQIIDCMKLSPDLVLLDVLLPDANGFDVLGRLRGTRDFADLPVLMLTSLGALDDILHGLKLGANGYLTKPAKSRVLLDAIKQVLA